MYGLESSIYSAHSMLQVKEETVDKLANSVSVKHLANMERVWNVEVLGKRVNQLTLWLIHRSFLFTYLTFSTYLTIFIRSPQMNVMSLTGRHLALEAKP